MHHSLKTMPTHGYLSYQGWALLNFHHYFSLRNIAHLFLFISLTLKHFSIIPCIFQKKSVFLHKISEGAAF